MASVDDVLARARNADWGPNLPTGDEAIDYGDVPAQDWSGGDAARGRYPELAASAGELIALDPDVRRAFPNSAAVNRALRALIEIARSAQD